jgi:REP element-mobilizing transposase RayT
VTYLITFSCYGNHLHGDEAGSVDRLHHIYRSHLVSTDPERTISERARLRESPYSIEPQQRDIVLQSIREVCLHRGWTLHAAHVRTTHVHVVAEGDLRPEAMMNAFKSYASRALNGSGIDGGAKARWARHGSTRWLWNKDDVKAAVDYVTTGQGEPMAVFLAEWTADRA